MSKYKRTYTVKLRTAHYISYSLLDGSASKGVRISVRVSVGVCWITVGILELIHEESGRARATARGLALSP